MRTPPSWATTRGRRTSCSTSGSPRKSQTSSSTGSMCSSKSGKMRVERLVYNTVEKLWRISDSVLLAVLFLSSFLIRTYPVKNILFCPNEDRFLSFSPNLKNVRMNLWSYVDQFSSKLQWSGLLGSMIFMWLQP